MDVGISKIRDKPAGHIERSPFIVALFFFCCLTIGIDVAVELALALSGGKTLSYSEVLHFGIEIIAVFAMILATVMAVISYLNLRKFAVGQSKVTNAIQTGFDRILVEKFESWKLTKSERDIALLAIRGLPVTAIAEHRETKEATVNVHLHNVYSKAGVGSRAELLASIMDELLSEHDLDGEKAIG